LELLIVDDANIFPGVLPPVTPSSFKFDAGDRETYLLLCDLGGALIFFPVIGEFVVD
jgi:hypothetical protein